MQYVVTLHVETDDPAAVETELEEIRLSNGEITDVGALEKVEE